MLNINQLVGFGAGGDDGNKHKFWRIRVDADEYSGAAVCALELEFRATLGGADQCSGGSVIRSRERVGYEATYAFDNSVSWACGAGYMWCPTAPYTGTNVGDWIGYEFAAPVAVAQVAYWGKLGVCFGIGRLIAATLQYSDDGITWYDSTSWSSYSVASFPVLLNV